MKARDVMTAPVLTVKSDSSVRDVAQLFVKHRISGAPVVDDQGHLVGMISEGDLMRRTELKSERQRSWWLGLLVDESAVANEYVKANSQKTSDVMAHPVMTVTPETPVADIAALFEKHGIKRVPVIENGGLVGLVSRANLVQAIASQNSTFQIQQSDVDIRERLLKKLRAEILGADGLSQRDRQRRLRRALGHCGNRYAAPSDSGCGRNSGWRACGQQSPAVAAGAQNLAIPCLAQREAIRLERVGNSCT